MTTWSERAERREEFELDHRTPIITDLDYALNCAAIEIDTTNARAELSDLRARVSELEEQIAQQAAQLEQARDHFNAISKMPPHFTDATAISEAIVIARDWLSSNPVSQYEAH